MTAKLPTRASRHPWVIAHRGASSSHPENTIAAFEQAAAVGSDGIELDVQLSRDGVPVVYHDWNLGLLGRPELAIRDLDANDIQRLDAGAHKHRRYRGEAVPLLSEVVERFASRLLLLIELKAHPEDRSPARTTMLVEQTIAIIRNGPEARIMLLCFEIEALRLAGSLEPGLPLVLNRGAPAPTAQEIDRLAAEVAAFSLDVGILQPAIVAAAHRRDREVFTWTCDDAEAVDHAVACGVDGMMSNRPAWLKQHFIAG